MNQEKIGKFIAKCRKEKNLTQEQLAEKLGITYKAVSKWECGKGLPDVSLYEILCKELDISLNEFFAGEHIKENQVIQKSEENIMNIVKDENQKKKNLKFTIIILIIIISFLIAIVFIALNLMKNYFTTAKTFKYNWKITIPSDLEEEYYTDSGPSFFGDGERYSVFNGSKFIMDFNSNKNQELEQRIGELNNKLNIPKENQIDFSHKYVWKKITDKEDERDELFIIYDYELNKYYFYELFV